MWAILAQLPLAHPTPYMLLHPQFDPVAFSIGPFAIHWYGLMYLLAFGQFFWLARFRSTRHPINGMHGLGTHELDDLLFYGMLGVVLGGRLGQILFYEPGYYLAHPIEMLMIWHGGMSFHGGLLGVLLALAWWSRKYQRHLWDSFDFVAPLVPLGLMAGRIGNFINGELYGRAASPDLPWAMVFPQLHDNLPRHPSQLYHALLEGLLLFVVLWWFASRPRQRGVVSGVFLIGYGCARGFVEFFREPDAGIFGHSYVVSMGQWLSLPMVLMGLFIILRTVSSPKQEQT